MTALLTVAAERPPIGGHGAVTGEALPLLQTHALMVARVLGACGAGTCRVFTAHSFLFKTRGWNSQEIIKKSIFLVWSF